MMFLGRPSALGGVDGLDVIAFGQGAFVTAQPPFGELVHALVGRRSARLDHVEDAAFVGGQSRDLPDDAAYQLRVFAQFLLTKERKKRGG